MVMFKDERTRIFCDELFHRFFGPLFILDLNGLSLFKCPAYSIEAPLQLYSDLFVCRQMPFHLYDGILIKLYFSLGLDTSVPIRHYIVAFKTLDSSMCITVMKTFVRQLTAVVS